MGPDKSSAWDLYNSSILAGEYASFRPRFGPHLSIFEIYRGFFEIHSNRGTTPPALACRPPRG
jgi:hypothetical protein